MADHPDTSISIPPFAKPLAPYLKSRQEAFRIRQILTLHLQSQIKFAEDGSNGGNQQSQPHLSLCNPQSVVSVDRVPADFSGLRKEYLEALRENVAARREYNALAEDVTSRKLMRQTNVAADAPPSNEPSTELQTYLALLRDRQRLQKLRVFEDHLARLDAPDTSDLDRLYKSGQSSLGTHQLDGQMESGTSDSSAMREGLGQLVYKLEKAVLRAKSQLDREKKLLEELQATRESLEERSASPGVKVAALQRIRDELVQWVEAKLVASGGEGNDYLPQFSQDEVDDMSRAIEERKGQIKEQYASYVEARRALLDSISVASQPLASPPAKSPLKSTPEGRPTGEVLDMEVLDLLPYASEVLLPLSKTQKSLALQKTYLSGVLAKEKSTARRMLDRLSDESHLLPEYPLLARQPRYKQAVAAISSRSTGESSEQGKPDEILSRAQAWAFASDAARTHERAYVEEKTDVGKEMAESAEQTLKEVYEIINQDYEEEHEAGASQDEGDIWASEVRPTRTRARQGRTEKRTTGRGPWSGLNGRVGVVGDV
ncbi:carbamoyl-phosphate synthase (glutamine-hydrolyzing) cpa2 [Paecilomyces lecythidis]|uniref:Carbamoyl-phosphate synthase (Glutamine-hydrolyzing) cpa2 n=1 Tax=Paecilomyces lecythidis TaxID=3004212 RepID=A0ABR3WVU5_9EURO